MLIPVLLHASTREAWGIRLRGNVLVLDEAHNVLETIGSLYSSEVTSVSTTFALSLIREYIDFYRSQLKSKNLMYMRQLLVVVAAMDQFLRKNSSPSEEVLTIQGFVIALGLTDVNLFKIVHYLDATDMCRKFHGFFIRAMRPKVSVSQSSVARGGIAKLMAGKAPEIRKPPPIVDDEVRNFPSPLFTIKQFLEALSNRCEDGRVIVEKKGSTAKFRFILLNPATRLLEVVNESRATILIGGTMEPADLLVSFLLSKIKSVAETVMLLVREVPNGSVAFFTSYDYMSHFLSIMEKFRTIQQCDMRKNVFVESRDSSEEIWNKFVAASRIHEGAVLFAVAGGKLSEGINFSDELGRAVFMIGLPYPNKNSVELKEKMKVGFFLQLDK
uniref:HELICc2 domain-containing protein n=1 Tax=Angiostrongylus cantonensis TaxID=6313 RepID=A0A0K0DP67_ANGCA